MGGSSSLVKWSQHLESVVGIFEGLICAGLGLVCLTGQAAIH